MASRDIKGRSESTSRRSTGPRAPLPRSASSPKLSSPTGNGYAAFAQQGYASNGSRSASELGGYRNWRSEEDEVERIQTKTKELKGQSVETSRRALAKLAQAEQVAAGNLEKLHRQGEQIRNVERRVDVAEAYADENDAKTDELGRLNRWFFLPTWGGGTQKSKAKKMAKGEEARMAWEKERKMKAEQQEQNEGVSVRVGTRGSSSYSGRNPPSRHGSSRRPPGYDEQDDEIDQNVDQISSGLSRLKMMALSMQAEAEDQNDRIVKVKDRTELVEERVKLTKYKVDQY